MCPLRCCSTVTTLRLPAVLCAALVLLPGCVDIDAFLRTDEGAVDTTAIRSALDSLRRTAESRVRADTDRVLASLHTEGAFVSRSGRPLMKGRGSIERIMQGAFPSSASLELEPTTVQILGTRRAHEVGRATLTVESGKEAGRTIRSTYSALLMQPGAGWKVHRLSIRPVHPDERAREASPPRSTDRPSQDLKPVPEVPSLREETVLALSGGGLPLSGSNHWVLPFAKYAGGSFYMVTSAWRREVLAIHSQYLLRPEAGAPPRRFSVDGMASEPTSCPPGTGLVGTGQVSAPLVAASRDARLDVGGAGRLAVSVPSNSDADLRSRLPSPDTTLTAAERRAIAKHVAMTLGDSDAERATIADRASALLALDADRQDSLAVEAIPYETQIEDDFVQADAGLKGVRNGASVSVGDVDGDGILDLVLTGANRGPFAGLYLGKRDGSFKRTTVRLSGKGTVNLTEMFYSASALADFNEDGRLDVLLTGWDNYDKVSTLYLSDGEEDLTFTKTNAGLQPVSKSATSVADVNEDGHLDVLVTGRDTNTVDTATLYLGNGDGSFAEANADFAGVSNGATSITDVNGDGHLDLVIVGWRHRGRIATLYLGTGDGSFTEANADLKAVSHGDISIGDVNEDGRSDLLITGEFYERRQSQTAAILYLGKEDGSFSQVKTNQMSVSFSKANADLLGVTNSATSIADVNGDGHLDLLIAGETANDRPTATLYLGEGDGTFVESGLDLQGVTTGATSIADLNGDGNLDLLVTGGTGSRSPPIANLYLRRGPSSLVVVERTDADVVSASSQKRRRRCGTGLGKRQAENGCVKSTRQVAAFLGQVTDGRWAGRADTVVISVHNQSLQLLDATGNGSPELFLDRKGYGVGTLSLIEFREGRFEEMLSFNSGC